MADLSVRSTRLLAPRGWHPAPAELIQKSADGEYTLAIAQLVAGNEGHWDSTLAGRAEISGEIARLAMAQVHPADPPGALFENLLAFHRPGPALSWFGLLHELREAVLADPRFPDWIDYATATWKQGTPFDDVLRDRLELLMSFWPAPARVPRHESLLASSTVQFEYLRAMRLHAHSLLTAHQPNARLTAANLATYKQYYLPFVQWLLSRACAGGDAPPYAFTVRFLAVYNTLITQNRQDPRTARWNLFSPRQGTPGPGVVDALAALEAQAVDGWPNFRPILKEDWGDWLPRLPWFGTRETESTVTNMLRAATGTLGPAWLTLEKESAGRPGYPSFYGIVSFETWRNTFLRRDLSDWRRRLPAPVKPPDGG
jgi:hypothetical protein